MSNPQRDVLVLQKKVLMQRIQSVQDQIKVLENNCGTGSEFHQKSESEEIKFAWIDAKFSEDDEESVDLLRRSVCVAEEVLGVTESSCSKIELPPHDWLPTGRWFQTTMNIAILDALKVELTIVECLQGGENKTLSVRVKPAAGESPRELASLLEHFSAHTASVNKAGSVQRMICALREYAVKTADRSFVLEAFREQFGQYLHAEITEEGIMVWWPPLFQLSWSLKWEVLLKRVVDSINIGINKEVARQLYGPCRPSLERLTESCAPRDVRLACLRRVGAEAALVSSASAEPRVYTVE